jgi:hypothetical protein
MAGVDGLRASGAVSLPPWQWGNGTLANVALDRDDLDDQDDLCARSTTR